MTFNNVSANALANTYFDGKIVSHAITMSDGSTKTMGIMFPGEYHLDTAAAELMEITSGAGTVKIDNEDSSATYEAGTHFNVGANSGFTITVKDVPCQYVCSYLAE